MFSGKHRQDMLMIESFEMINIVFFRKHQRDMLLIESFEIISGCYLQVSFLFINGNRPDKFHIILGNEVSSFKILNPLRNSLCYH